MSSVDPLLAVVLGIGMVAALSAVLVISLFTVRRPATAPMAVSTVIVAAALVVVIAAQPIGLSPAIGIPLTAVSLAAATVGGNPFTRRALDIATGNRVRETEDGGILIIAAQESDPENTRTLMRGGTVIGYLERVATVIAITVGFPEAVAAVIAVKGVGRFPELAESEARERFIVGTVASLLWAGVIGAIVRLSLG